MTNDLTTGADFGRATASWFGMDAGKVSADLKLTHGQNDVLSVTLTIMLGPDDIAGIGKRMKEIAAGSRGIVSVEVPKVDPRCKRAMQLTGAKAWPRTCPVCKLGPCKFQVPVPDLKGE